MTKWKLVPEQTTLEMRNAGSMEADKMLVNYTNGCDIQRWWKTVLKAAPSPAEDIDLTYEDKLLWDAIAYVESDRGVAFDDFGGQKPLSKSYEIMNLVRAARAYLNQHTVKQGETP